MKRLVVASLFILTALGALILLGFTILSQPPSLEERAVSIALADPGVKNAITNSLWNYEIKGVTPQEQVGKSGFINVSNTLVAVNMSVNSGMYAPDRYVVFVDLNQSQVAGSEWYSYRGSPAEMDITLPPGASYYHTLSGSINAVPGPSEGFGEQTFWCRLNTLSPGNATVFPILVDEENLRRLKNGSSYVAATYNDTSTKKQAVMNGTEAISPGWSVNASVQRSPRYDTGNWPDFDFSRRYYIVFRNVGSDTVNLTVGM